MPAQDGREQQPLAAAHVDDPAEPREVVGVHDLLGHRGVERGHRLVEDPPPLGVLPAVVEQPHPVHELEGRLTRAHRLQELAPRPPRLGAGDEPGVRPDAGNVLPERLGQGRGLEPPITGLGEDLQAGQGPEEAEHRSRVGAAFRR